MTWADTYRIRIVANLPLPPGFLLVALRESLRKKILDSIVSIPLVVLLEGVRSGCIAQCPNFQKLVGVQVALRVDVG